MKKMTSLVCVAVGLVMAGAALAKVPAAEADRLGKDLTCVGAEKAASKDGEIPAYGGKWLGTPPGVAYTPNVGQHPVDPYAADKPLLSITAENLAQHASRLSSGQKALFARFPKAFRMDVYPARRDFRYPDYVCESARKNALHAELTDGGLGIKGAVIGAVPFPMPKDGMEVLMNNAFPYRAFTEDIVRDQAHVLPSGSISWGRLHNISINRVNGVANAGQPLDSPMTYVRTVMLLPERDKGALTVSVEPVNFATGRRMAWRYDPPTRRSSLLPEYAYDQPIGGTNGKVTIDSDRLFNGSPDRYHWKLLGKQELYVPANAYRLHAKTVRYAELLKPGVPNPDFIRWELRRVWVIEGSLKEGASHLYSKRVLFIDEDTWHAVMTDLYDRSGTLAQYAYINHYYAFDMQGWHPGTAFYHDLSAGDYVGYNLFQEREKGPVLNKGSLTVNMFNPETLRPAAP